MFDLPENYKIKIINRYGETGKEWLENVDAILGKYQKQFCLEDIQLIENLSINLVAFAKCDLYGDVIIKIGTPGPTALSEINIMKYYSSQYVPKTYYSSITDRVQVLERIFPGYCLKNLENREERVKVFCDLSNHLLILANGEQNFQTFEENFKSKINYAYENKATYSDLLSMIDTATNLYQKIKDLHLPKYILHNDLHHKNILKAKTSWKAIDPHGIIGEKVFEACNFIRSEIENVSLEKNNINKIVSLISQYYKEDKQLILEALYIYIIEKIIFYTKNKADVKRISYNVNICKELLKMLK